MKKLTLAALLAVLTGLAFVARTFAAPDPGPAPKRAAHLKAASATVVAIKHTTKSAKTHKRTARRHKTRAKTHKATAKHTPSRHSAKRHPSKRTARAPVQ